MVCVLGDDAFSPLLTNFRLGNDQILGCPIYDTLDFCEDLFGKLQGLV